MAGVGGQRCGDDLDVGAPVAALRFARGPQGWLLDGANGLALDLLGAPPTDVLGTGFASHLYDRDALDLATALDRAGPDPSEPVLLRWGLRPPCTFVAARFQRRTDATVVAALHDQTDQYRLDTFVCGRGAGLFLIDDEDRTTWLSPLTRLMLGVPSEQVIGTDSNGNVHPDEQPALRASLGELRSHPGEEFVRYYHYAHPSAPGSWWRVRQTRIFLPDEPAVGGILGKLELAVDPPDEAQRAGMGLEATIAEVMPSGVIIGTRSRVAFRNGRARRMFGTSVDADDPFAFIERLREEDRPTVRDRLSATMERGERHESTVAIDRPGDRPAWVRIETTPTLDPEGHPAGFMAMFLDVTEETETKHRLTDAQRQLWHLANHDMLTGLPNRMQLESRLEHALARNHRHGSPVAVLFCDLDGFKRINDGHGHETGDAVLAEIGRRFAEVTRLTDTLCRMGGDEFVVVCEGGGDRSGPEILADRLIEAASRPVEVAGVRVQIGLSVGIAHASAGSTPRSVLAAADAALYEAKASGRGRAVVA